ncbi:MAG: Asp-tRNA(Asn)/Glu-tRNA(Gln) amidotransferase subunit GatC [Candidatus Bathyarchaeota archaeon]|nr:Asp-tRNA(Asn)/Glu-tRNA(Gln) amidotransferase subunit GatC [Candidatus Bathyarchaeota archaeon]
MSKEKVSDAKPQIKHLSWLARIELTEQEEQLFASQLSDILDLFKKIEKIPLDEVPPTYHALELTNVWRADVVEPSMSDEILKRAPQLKNRYVKAPRMG